MRFTPLLLLASVLLTPTAALALDPPSGPVLLRVSGQIEVTNVGEEAHFDRDMLLALPQHETVTETPWHDGAQRFSGPLGRALLDAVGAQSDTLRVTALNDYAASVPADDLLRYDVIFAMSRNDTPLRVRDQGPLFLVYPFDEHPHLRNEEVLARSVWQIASVRVGDR